VLASERGNCSADTLESEFAALGLANGATGLLVHKDGSRPAQLPPGASVSMTVHFPKKCGQCTVSSKKLTTNWDGHERTMYRQKAQNSAVFWTPADVCGRGDGARGRNRKAKILF